MPTYEYACKACDHRFEIVQSFSEDALTTCPDCEQDELRKVYNAAGIIFKGDGWHIKDYGTSKSPASSGSSETTSSSDSGSKETTGSKDTKGSKDAKGSKGASSKSSKSGGDAAAKPAAN